MLKTFKRAVSPTSKMGTSAEMGTSHFSGWNISVIWRGDAREDVTMRGGWHYSGMRASLVRHPFCSVGKLSLKRYVSTNEGAPKCWGRSFTVGWLANLWHDAGRSGKAGNCTCTAQCGSSVMAILPTSNLGIVTSITGTERSCHVIGLLFGFHGECAQQFLYSKISVTCE